MNELKQIFTEIYENNSWSSKLSKSGIGSEVERTRIIINELPEIFKKFNIKTFLDIPCGDFNWMSYIDFKGVEYVGADIVESLIEDNKKRYDGLNFEVLDITEDKLPQVDLIFARDILGHLSYENINKSLYNIVESGSKYLLTTSFTKWNYNTDIKNGDWRPINLMIEPFCMKPIYLINEDCSEGGGEFNDKCLLLFEIKRMYCCT